MGFVCCALELVASGFGEEGSTSWQPKMEEPNAALSFFAIHI